MKTTHELKLLPQYFTSVMDGSKTFEVRKFDRDYKVGDTLVLNEYDLEKGFTGEKVERLITYLLNDEGYVKEGFVILGIK